MHLNPRLNDFGKQQEGWTYLEGIYFTIVTFLTGARLLCIALPLHDD